MIHTLHNRRHFLKTAGGGLVALPFLASLLGETEAMAMTPQLRFITLFNGHGQSQRNWHPGIDLYQQGGSGFRSFPLGDLTAPLSSVLEPLTPYRSDLNILGGLDSLAQGHNHNPRTTLCAGGTHQSVDQILQQSSRFNPNRLGSMHLVGSNVGYKNQPISYRKSGQGVQGIDPIHNPQMAFDAFFGSQVGDEARRRRKTIASLVLEDFKNLRRDPRLSLVDQQRLDEYLTHLDELQKKIDQTGSGGEVLKRPTVVPNVPDSSQDDEVIDAHIDLIVLAVRCNQLATATLQFSTDTDNSVYSFLGVQRDFHTISHENNLPATELPRINRWMAGKVARLIEKLRDVENSATGERYLDSTLVYWGNDMGCMPTNGSNHQANDMPILTAGSGGKRFVTGQYLTYGDFRRNQGRPYNDFLISILQGFGLSPDEYEQNGAEGFGTYERLRRWDAESRPVEGVAYDLSQKRQTLPGFLSK
ncbi:MAG TPA: DUF1552 domain-containing protein [Oligoflexus sp.]|uniref:DUF1552 domain-containing protein n=1 Tax=Oligoflexus sp. TaxID=1971216 RepID=UPI002D7E8FA1|nr:DUF1552 domain-containing protein [Oligoflexus sp.]HET9236612.1 DUF1552 domain-containing protein [Oligoflexus sp.]